MKGSVYVLSLPAEYRRGVCARAMAAEGEVAQVRAVG